MKATTIIDFGNFNYVLEEKQLLPRIVVVEKQTVSLKF